MASSGGAGAEVFYYLEKTPAQVQAEVNEAVALLVQRGFRADLFAMANITRAGYISNNFLKLVKPLTSIKDERKLANVLVLGLGTYWTAPDMCDLGALIKFCKWLKGPGGQDAIRKKNKEITLARRAKGTLGVADVALIQMARVQMNDYSSYCKQWRAYYDDQILKLRRQIRRLEGEKESKLEAAAALLSTEAYALCAAEGPVVPEENVSKRTRVSKRKKKRRTKGSGKQQRNVESQDHSPEGVEGGEASDDSGGAQ